MLRALGCDYGQGFHVARPADAKATAAVLGATFICADDEAEAA